MMNLTGAARAVFEVQFGQGGHDRSHSTAGGFLCRCHAISKRNRIRRSPSSALVRAISATERPSRSTKLTIKMSRARPSQVSAPNATPSHRRGCETGGARQDMRRRKGNVSCINTFCAYSDLHCLVSLDARHPLWTSRGLRSNKEILGAYALSRSLVTSSEGSSTLDPR
jgi:hypothetical protein